ncbi:kinase-like domain-containing protein [Desarmillaria tabescens]|uniref:Kinase-like domain-containing protein n=1 Tax=Armillaria tabescens TaxID=1929756 RepID=A0AA39NEV7_ARMTA|nr:kinase-like domain-containing protein [Desarmillaria tabescens]KAK0464358.1 kinase-like domain-containing protein [Desarmillaria tabescens]
MDPASPPSPPHEANDIFSLSDSVLSSKLRFIEEIGFGNWGSVWLCNPKNSPTSHAADDFDRVLQPKIAVKLVHRNTKSKTTVARVKSLWNEMKIIRTFKSDPHPSIIPFYSFVITPSYALITMAYLPALVPVEVDESRARGWFRFLLSGVDFLHKRGVVHNDIKPANILISHKNIPVLVDFGFAEKYGLDSETAFHSKVSYGTPEYLSPERAREIPHDCRKSDVWSLGVTFFEILTGRTPFEECDQEQFTTKEDLEKYWSRTLRGKWIGSWTMSKGMEKLLRRMISPNADLRCTASQAMQDPYWQTRKEEDPRHRRSSSYTSSLVFEKDMSKQPDLTSSRPQATKGKENLKSPLALFSSKSPKAAEPDGHRTVARSKSQPKVIASKSLCQEARSGPSVNRFVPNQGFSTIIAVR